MMISTETVRKIYETDPFLVTGLHSLCNSILKAIQGWSPKYGPTSLTGYGRDFKIAQELCREYPLAWKYIQAMHLADGTFGIMYWKRYFGSVVVKYVREGGENLSIINEIFKNIEWLQKMDFGLSHKEDKF